MVRFMWRHWRHRERHVEVPPGHVLTRQEIRRQLAEHRGRASLTWLGHASFLIEIAGKMVLTDPYLGETAGPAGFGPKRYVPPALSVEELPDVDILLISHNHYDHLDLPTLRRLSDKSQVEVLVPLKLGDFFRGLGYTRVHELDWYDARYFDDLQIMALPAVHFSRRQPFDRNRSLWCGFALQGGDHKLYFSGDTAHGAIFREVGAVAGGFDLAIVGIGAYLPRRIMQASHTTPEEALKLADDIGAARVLGMHWGTVVLTDEDPFEPPQRFRRAAEAVGLGPDRAWLMAIGETRALPGPWPRN